MFLHAFKISNISSAYQGRMFIISSLTSGCFYSNNLRIAWRVSMKILLNTTPNENVPNSFSLKLSELCLHETMNTSSVIQYKDVKTVLD
jgi:hypothetical protein